MDWQTKFLESCCNLTDGTALGEGAFTSGLALSVSRREIAHFDDERTLDVRLTKAVIRSRRDELTADERVSLRRGGSDWLGNHCRRRKRRRLGETSGDRRCSRRTSRLRLLDCRPPVQNLKTASSLPLTSTGLAVGDARSNRNEMLAVVPTVAAARAELARCPPASVLSKRCEPRHGRAAR